jgi:carbonic anhydrase
MKGGGQKIMRLLKELFDGNREWAAAMERDDPGFFERLSKGQTPRYLWIGCSDSRVPANEIIGLPPGEVFVHRNVANLVIQTDMNLLSVLQYAVDILKIEHVIVCGHYGCGGVETALRGGGNGLIDNWLRHVAEIAEANVDELDAIVDWNDRVNRLCELNVIKQVQDVVRTTITQEAWRRGQNVAVHGWIYSLRDGLLRDLDVTEEN